MSTPKLLDLTKGEGGFKVAPGCAIVLLRNRDVDLRACTLEQAKELASMPNCDQVSHPDITAAAPATAKASNVALPAPPPPVRDQNAEALAEQAATAEKTEDTKKETPAPKGDGKKS